MVFDCFPFFNEFDVLEIRLNELCNVVDEFVIMESGETYGGTPKPYLLYEAMAAGRFMGFQNRIRLLRVDTLRPACTDRAAGRLREAYQRNMIWPYLYSAAAPDDVIIFSDCDEIPRADAVRQYLELSEFAGIRRFKQRSFYYNVNRLVDYGHDFASRARIGRWSDALAVGDMYSFRMANKDSETAVIENGGWHFGYFGTGLETIKTKVAAMSPFLAEYKLFGDMQLAKDIVAGKDLHHRRCEMPDTFWPSETNDPTLPAYFLENQEKFAHFTEVSFRERHIHLLRA